jgi:hypothetical protein
MVAYRNALATALLSTTYRRTHKSGAALTFISGLTTQNAPNFILDMYENFTDEKHAFASITVLGI